MAIFFDVLAKSLDFNGRASRKEFGVFFLFSSIIELSMVIVDVNLYRSNPEGSLGLFTLFSLFLLFLPYTALKVRRLHDSDQSGWGVLVGIIPFVGFIVQMSFLFAEGNAGPNQYGEAPHCLDSSAKINDPAEERFVPKFNKDK